jgi:hypothetical protein
MSRLSVILATITCSVLPLQAIFDKKPSNVVENIVVLATPIEQQALERGTIQLYFNKSFKKNMIVRHCKDNSMALAEFHFPASLGTVVLPAEKLLKKEDECLHYQSAITNNDHEIVVSITYDPTKVTVTHDFIEDLQLRKGIEIKVYDEELIRKLRQIKKPILLTACC